MVQQKAIMNGSSTLFLRRLLQLGVRLIDQGVVGESRRYYYHIDPRAETARRKLHYGLLGNGCHAI